MDRNGKGVIELINQSLESMISKDLVNGGKRYIAKDDSIDNIKSNGKETNLGKKVRYLEQDDDLLEVYEGGNDTFNSSSICEMPQTSPKKSIKYTNSED